ncbi:MAG: molybdate ABC transporter substrate-binding protein [Rubrobacter sp.]|nr:molybdate ABC transporter substrate-binding protein [Rubrobacter sp.]
MGLRRGRVLVRSLLLLALLSLTVGLAGCSGAPGSGSTETTGGGQTSGGTVTVLAAASLTDAFKELTTTFEEQNPNAKVSTSFGASSALLAQIQQGAPADVFASADEAKMNTAVQDSLVNTPQIFARNRPVVIVPKSNPADIHELRDLAKPGSKLVLEQDGVPIAEYSKQILNKANSQYGADFEQQVMNNVVSREADVRASANRVALGDADATFVYITDVTPDIADQVEVIEIPKDLNVIATYPIATLKQATNPELAQKWVDLVLSDEGQGVLEKYGFERSA